MQSTPTPHIPEQMALVNFTLPFGNSLAAQSPWTTISPLQRHATAINNMLYDPAGHQQHQSAGDDGAGGEEDYYDDGSYKNDPYAPPPQQQQQQQQQQQHQQQQRQQQQHQQLRQQRQQPPQPQQQQTYGRRTSPNDYLPPAEQQRRHPPQPAVRNLYLPQPGSHRQPDKPPQLQPPPPPTPQHQQHQYYNQYDTGNQQQPHIGYGPAAGSLSPPSLQPPTLEQRGLGRGQVHANAVSGPSRGGGGSKSVVVDGDGLSHEQQPPHKNGAPDAGYASQAPTYTRVQAGSGSKTQVHAVLDYDEDEEEEYDEEDDGKTYQMPTVTPIQGPIFLKNGSVPVVPLFSYPTLRNGSFMQIPIWWTALSVALGLEVRSDVIRGTPCVKRHNQLFCPTAGTSYPINRIESFIDENKALMRRMYGDFEMSTQYGPPSGKGKRKRQTDEFEDGSLPPGVPDFVGPPGSDMDEIPMPDMKTGDSFFSKWRSKRQSTRQSGRNGNSNAGGGGGGGNRQSAGPTPPNEKVTGRLDACESKIEIVTPYWASNSAGKVRAIVNTQHFEQAIHQEVCTKTQTGRCGGDCGCEQKYKWHRLLAYDPDNDCRGIFMDWFLFPSCCVCRCDP